MYDHKLIVWNAGQLPPDWSLAYLMDKHPSQPPNPDIARTLFLAGLIESWGRGIDLLRRTCLADGSPAPKFDCDSTGFWVEFQFASSPSAVSVETPVKTLVKTPDAILKYLTDNPRMTLAEVAAQTGKSLSAVERASAKLVKEGKLLYVGPQKGGHCEVLT